MTFWHRLFPCVLCGALAAMALGRPVWAQSLTSGALQGIVRDAAGTPLSGARITVTGAETGVSRVIDAARDGRFEIALLPPGTYHLLAERLGHRPRRVEAIRLPAGRRLVVEVVLAESTPPVDRVDVESFAATAADDASTEFSAVELAALPAPGRDLGELARLSSQFSADLGSEGLPAHMTGIVVDGVSVQTARHPALAMDPFRTVAVPLGAVGQAAFLPGAVDVEWPGGASGRVVAFTRQGGRDLSAKAFGRWSGDALAAPDFYKPAPYSSFEGGLIASGPLLRDTAHFAVGVEARRLETPLPPIWELASVAAASRAVARDSFGIGIANLERPRIATTEVVSAFGRLDWNVSDAHALGVRANVATIPATGLEPTAFGTRGLGGRVEGRDVFAAVSLTSQFGQRLIQELRIGFGQSTRDFLAGGEAAPFTGLVDGGLAVGLDAGLPARFERTSVEATQSLHYSIGVHRLKGGIALEYASYDDAYAYGRTPSYLFGGVDAFARGEGLFQRIDGPPPALSFSIPHFALFLQDTWTAVPGLELTVGLRYELERLPTDKVRLDEEWFRLTGLANAGIKPTVRRFVPRIGLTWDVQQRHRWLVHASAGVFHDRVDPALLSELLWSDGRPSAYRALGSLGGWPEPALSAATVDSGRVVTLLAPDFVAPQTTRASLGVSRVFGTGTTVSIFATRRRTEFLPRRTDLNLLATPVAEDQYGRPIYGSLTSHRGLLAATPGSNRRFDAYDRAYAISADGRSDYWGVSVDVEHHTGGPLSFFGRYTYSETRDDWLSGRGGAPDEGLNPFPAGLDGADWADGRSDFDIPHRAAVGAELNFAVLSGLRIAGVYRFRSGDPFTPGFRYGIDANGDGSPGNDPAFVDDGIDGMDALIDTWDCLRDHVGGFVERNACRMPDVHAFDLRLGIGLPRVAGVDAELVIDAFDLIESEIGVPDRALYRVDAKQPLGVDAANGRVTVPLVANPHFGKLLQRWGSGRTVRIGLRVDY